MKNYQHVRYPAKGQNLSRWMKMRCLTARLSLCHLCYRDLDCWLVSKLNLSYTHHWMSKPQLINIALDSWHSFAQQFVSRPHTYIFPLSKTSLTTLVLSVVWHLRIFTFIFSILIITRNVIFITPWTQFHGTNEPSSSMKWRGKVEKENERSSKINNPISN